jgi:tetratricopeptide (TPR) repeat protein
VISTNHIASFLRDIFFNARSGRLIFKRKEIEKYFFFCKGKPIQVKTSVRAERLGEILFKLQKIQEETFSQIDDFIEINQPLGESLKKTGVIKEADLREALAFQIRECLLSLFSYFDADISFQERQDIEPPQEFPAVDIPFIIDYGIRRMKPEPTIQKFFIGKKAALKNIRYTYFLTEEEQALLDRFSTLQLIDGMSVAAPFSSENFYKCLYLFHCLDMIELAEADSGYQKAGLDKESKQKLEQDELEARLQELREIKASLKNRNYYELLGVSRVATEEEIKRAYFSLARKYHPDRFNREIGEMSLINEVFNAITTAYRTLSDEEKRKQYEAQLSSPVQELIEDLAKKAEVKYRQGRTLYNQGMYEEAIIFFEEAIRLKRNKADYYLLLAMAESKLPAYKKKAEQDYLRAVEMEPWNPEGYLGLGMLYLSEGLRIKAKRQFKKALEVDPDHQQAKIALADMEKGEKKTGLKSILNLDFSELFKKKK